MRVLVTFMLTAAVASMVCVVVVAAPVATMKVFVALAPIALGPETPETLGTTVVPLPVTIGFEALRIAAIPIFLERSFRAGTALTAPEMALFSVMVHVDLLVDVLVR